MKKGAPSLNPKGRTVGSKSVFQKSKIIIEAGRDLNKMKRFYRAVLNNDFDILTPEFGIMKISDNMRLSALKELRAIDKEEVQLEKARLLELEAERDARQMAKDAPKGATFSMKAGTVAPIKQAV